MKVHDHSSQLGEINKLQNFPPVYYVTLEESIERQKNIINQFLDYNIVPNALKSKRFSDSKDIITGKYLYQLTGPTQGCIVSHLKAIKLWYENNDSEYAFFCEDDLSLKTVEHWGFTWQEFIDNLPNDWECVQLMTIRGNFEDICFRERVWDDWSETAYILKRNYAKKLIENYCIDDTFCLELKGSNVMPIGENILFTGLGKVYTFPLFVENVSISTTDVNDTEVEDGQKPNHIYSSEYVYDWWKTNGKLRSIESLMQISKISNDESEKNILKNNIVDCFTYFNEKELLELRINLLKDHVDKFIIVDANYTHSGIPKEFTCKKTIKELGLPEEIIEVIEVDLSEDSMGPPSSYDLYWDNLATHASRERFQRDSISKCLETNQFDNDTIFIVGDCDEIIDPKNLPMLCNIVRSNRDKIFKIDLDYLAGRADLQVFSNKDNSLVEWRYSLFLCMKEHMQIVPLTNIRSDLYNPFKIVWPYTDPKEENGVHIPGKRMENLGWHFSWMGSNADRLLKSKSFCHFGQPCDFYGLNQETKCYGSLEVDNFISSYTPQEGSVSPSGFSDTILKKYSIENLPKIIFELPKVKNYLLPDYEIETEKKVQKNIKVETEMEQLVYDFSLDTENPMKNFKLGVSYEKQGHTAPAVSYFLRCAERAADTDKNLAYEALVRASHCYDKQGTRDGSARSLLWQAQMFLPSRPEAYYLLARIAEKNEWWQDCYSTCQLALLYCDFNSPDLITYVEYPGKHGLMFLKANAAWWWGKGDESRFLYKSILDNYELNEHDHKLISEKLNNIKKG